MRGVGFGEFTSTDVDAVQKPRVGPCLVFRMVRGGLVVGTGGWLSWWVFGGRGAGVMGEAGNWRSSPFPL